MPVRVVIDTNVWISRLLLANSPAGQAVDKALAKAEVVVSEATVEELAGVLARRKFDKYVSVPDRQDFLRRFLRIATMVPVLFTAPPPAASRRARLCDRNAGRTR